MSLLLLLRSPAAVQVAASGSVAGASGVSGAAAVGTPGAGTVAATSGGSGATGRLMSAAGSVAAASNVAGSMGRLFADSGEAAAVSTVTGAATPPNVQAAAGSATAASIVTGSAALRHYTASTTPAVSATTGAATVVARIPTAGTTDAVSDTTGDATVAPHTFAAAGNIRATTSTTGATLTSPATEQDRSPMPLTSATITYDIADLTGADFDSRRTKIWVTTNIPTNTIVDTDGNQVRLGDGRGSIADDGTGSVTVWVPGAGSNPASWQTSIHVDYQPRGNGGRVQRTFGPFTITGNSDLADLIAEEAIPPEAVGGDDAVASFVNDPASATAAAISALVGPIQSSTGNPAAFAAQVKPLVSKLAANATTKAMIVGSSIPSGYNVNGSTVEGTYQADTAGTGRQIFAALATKYSNTNLTVVNAGVAGNFSRICLGGGQANGHIAAIGAWLAKEKPDVVLLNLNSNDALTSNAVPVAEYELNYRNLIRECRRFGATVLAVPPFTHYTPASTDLTLLAQHKAAALRAMALEGVQPLPVQDALNDPSNPANPLSGTTTDGTHPNATGAAQIGAAAAAYFPAAASLDSVPNVSATRQPTVVYTDPAQRGGYAEWITADGDTRRHRVQPTQDVYTARGTGSDLDGWSTATPPGVPAALRMRGSVACYDFVQGTSATVLYDKSGSGNNGTVAGTPVWNSGGGMVFDGVDDVIRIPLDALGKLKATPPREWFTARIVFKPSTAGATQNLLTRRGDSGFAPFGMFLNGGKLNLFERAATIDTGATPSTTAYEDWVVSWSVWDNRIRYFRNGALVGGQNLSGIGAVAGDNWDWLIGSRFVGTDPTTATPTGARFAGTIQWVDLARSYVSPAGTEIADLYASLKAVLNTRSGVALP